MFAIFARMKLSYFFNFFTAFSLFSLIAGCGSKDKNTDDPIPFATVDRYYNTSSPGYIVLNNPGGWIVDSTAGVRGLFVIKNYSNEYKAFDLCCSYHPLDACSKLTPDSSGLYFKCGKYVGGLWQPCCDSKFGIDGVPTKAPATRLLRQYQTSFDGSVLRVFN